MTKDLIRRCMDRINPLRTSGTVGATGGEISSTGKFLSDVHAQQIVVTILDELSRDLTALAWGATPGEQAPMPPSVPPA